MESTRRKFFTSSLLIFGTSLTVGSHRFAFSKDKKDTNKLGVSESSPVEDLMSEHGILNRVLLIYEEGLRRIHTKENLNPDLIKKSAILIRDFIEGHHEKLEEEYIFPRLKKAGKLTNLVDTLFAQHQSGKKLTLSIIAFSTQAHMKNDLDVGKLTDSLTKFIRMYRPHEAREDTVLFPMFKTLVTQKEYDNLGELFEEKENKLFGKKGFEDLIVQISEIEKALGIYELEKFTT